MPISTIPVKWLQGASNHHTSRFEVEPTCPFGHGASKDISTSSNQFWEERGSPRVVNTTTGSLVGRGIANPMSERTRGFELPINGTKFPLPALFLLLLLLLWGLPAATPQLLAAAPAMI
jgi:hypothetical protein